MTPIDAPRLLDITRLMRRSGRVLTGIDRVELAYLRAVLADTAPAFGLIRSPYGYVLLGERGLAPLLERLACDPGDVWRVARRGAVARVPPPMLPWALRRAGLGGARYINVGHSNLTRRVLRATKSVGMSVAVMIHDVIPLQYPEFQRDGSVERFARLVARVGRHADLLIYNSYDTAAQAAAFLPTDTPSIVAHLGTELPEPDPSAIPGDVPVHAPYFVCVGTIEPRKNHAFLLDLWEALGADAPGLIFAGRRGWKNEDVFARLDALPPGGPVREVPDLSDAALSALIRGARGLLFPSHAEGFGLPAIEAAVLGTPVIASPLPVFREVLGNIPIYASVSDRYLWQDKIEALVNTVPSGQRHAQFQPPTWAAHFKTVLSLT